MNISNDPLYKKTLKIILQELVDDFGWEKLGMYINIRCFQDNPSISSSLKFLRTTPWARTKVENLYISMIGRREHKG